MRLLLLVVAVLLIYSPLASFPHVQDDWSVLHTVTFTPFVTFLGNAIIPAGGLFYRPIPLAYFSFLHALCGLCPALFHALSLLALILTSLLVVDAGTRLANSTAAGWCAGFLFATAASVHLDTQMWLVGSYEIGALFFALVAVCFVLRGRYAASALSVAAALGCKEAAITLPFILVVIWYAAVRIPGRAGAVRELWMRFRAHAGGRALLAAGLQTWNRDSTLRVASVSPGSRVLDGKISLLFPPDDPEGGSGKPGFVEEGQILVFRLVSDSLVGVPSGEYLPRKNP